MSVVAVERAAAGDRNEASEPFEKPYSGPIRSTECPEFRVPAHKRSIVLRWQPLSAQNTSDGTLTSVMLAIHSSKNLAILSWTISAAHRGAAASRIGLPTTI